MSGSYGNGFGIGIFQIQIASEIRGAVGKRNGRAHLNRLLTNQKSVPNPGRSLLLPVNRFQMSRNAPQIIGDDHFADGMRIFGGKNLNLNLPLAF